MDLNLKIYSGRLAFVVDDDYHEVELFVKGKKLKKGYGYIKGNYVYIYRGKKDKYKKTEMKPGIYQDKHGEYIFIEPDGKQEEAMYSTDNLIELNINKIFEDVRENKEHFIDSEYIEVINNNSQIYTPTIHEDDDFLKYAVKEAIIRKKINLKNYKNKFPNQYALNNMKSGLNKSTKMTVPNFNIWCEILGLKWRMVIEDDGSDKLSPLDEPIEIKSEDF